MRTAHTYMVFIGAACLLVIGVHDFLRSPGLTLGERIGALCFRLILSAIGFGHFAYRVKQSRKTAEDRMP